MEKAVKGATKIKLAAPKSKYVEAILHATSGGEAGVADVFRTLQVRLRESTWTIVFKALIIVHLMIREGAADVTLRYIAESPKRLAISAFTEVQTQGSNIRRYSEYLLERVRGYRDTKADFVRVGTGRLKSLTVDKGLLRETEAVQSQIRALIKCDIFSTPDPDNEISLTAFRLLTMDLLELFKVMNEGTINVLEHYFEMSRPDAERALAIYKTFGRQTEQVVQYLSLARQYESSTRLEVPKLKHAPTTLTSSLEEYLNDPDFEVNRRQYLAQQQAKRSGKPMPSSKPTAMAPSLVKTEKHFPTASSKSIPPPTKGPAPDLIDFFESIEQNQLPMAQSAGAPQFSGALSQPQQFQEPTFTPLQGGYNPFLPSESGPQPQPQPLQQGFAGAGFGGYTPQPPQSQQYSFQPQLTSIPQNGIPQFQGQTLTQPAPAPLQPQQTSTNPFRQSVMQIGTPTSMNSSPYVLNRQSTNPFTRNNTVPAQSQGGQTFPEPNGVPSVSSPPPLTQQQDFQSNSVFYSSQSTSPPQPQPPNFTSPQLQPQSTGTNPFAKNRSPPPASTSQLVASPTGSTNPFRQSAFVNQQTGQGWQYSQQGTFSGFDINGVDTRPVFPRPGQG